MVWWVVDVALLAVIPLLVKLLRDVLEPVAAIVTTADALADAGAQLVADLAAVTALVETRDMISHTGAGLTRYGAALDAVL